MSILDSLKFESKRSQFTTSEKNDALSNTPSIIEAFVLGTQIVIKNTKSAKWLYLNGNFGSFIGHRMDFVNNNCFSNVSIEINASKNDNEMKDKDVHDETSKNIINNADREDLGRSWLRTKRSNNWLFLSLIEALYLLDIKKISRSNFNIEINKSVLNFVEFKINDFYDSNEFYCFIYKYIFGRTATNELEIFAKR